MVDEINNPPPPPVPQNTNSSVIFGKYEMGKKLGQGNFAKVYHCRNILTNDGVAIKVISKDHIMNSSCNIEQVQREISVMKLVRHPNIVEIKEVMATKSKIFVVMEYVKGGELFAKIVKGKLNEDEARKYFQQLISAVDFCHSRGVTHRDLKPENLLLDENGNLKVSDFGLSALPDQRRPDGLLYTQCGTPAYVAPEVLRKKGYAGHKADVWSCGVVLFVLLAGHLPFHDVNVVRMYRKVFKGDYQFPPCFPDDARQLVSKLLVVDPEKRMSIDGIMMSDPWFLRGWIREWPVRTIADEFDADPNSKPQSTSSRFYSAFELISSLSSGFDLSSLFTEKRNKARSLFASKISASGVISRLESAVKRLGFSVSCKENRVRMEGKNEGRKGRLMVVAEVFEVAPQLAVVEFSKCCGDTLEYARFCSEEVRPALKDIVWSWQGEG